MRRYHYLMTISVATLLGLLGGPLLARYLLGIAGPTLSYALQSHNHPLLWTALSLRVWTPTCCVLLIVSFLIVGQTAHRNFESAAQTVYHHQLAFYRRRNQVCTPGTVFDYLIWAYTYAIVRSLTGFASFTGIFLIPPFLLSQSWGWRIVLLIVFFFVAEFMSRHVGFALDQIYGEIPQRLGRNLKMFGPLMNYLFSLDEEESSSL